jgi:hypothetical protein
MRKVLLLVATAAFGCAARLPDLSLGSPVPRGAHQTGGRIMISPAQFQQEWVWRFDGVDYMIGVDDRGTVQYLATRSTKVVTHEGVHVGQSFSDVGRIESMHVVAWPGWGYVIELPSGWSAAFFVGSSMTDREPVAEDAVAMLFRGRSRESTGSNATVCSTATRG